MPVKNTEHVMLAHSKMEAGRFIQTVTVVPELKAEHAITHAPAPFTCAGDSHTDVAACLTLYMSMTASCMITWLQQSLQANHHAGGTMHKSS